MVGVAGGRGGGAVGFWPDTKSGGGGGAVGFWPNTKSGVLSASGPIRKVGGGGGGYDRVSGSPGHSTVVQFMRTGVNSSKQRKRAAIIIKCGPNL